MTTTNITFTVMPQVRYDKRCYFNVSSKADMSQLNLPHGSLTYHTSAAHWSSDNKKGIQILHTSYKNPRTFIQNKWRTNADSRFTWKKAVEVER